MIAVADVNTPWRERRGQARWVAPNGETYTARAPAAAGPPGDTILYDYLAAGGFEPPPSSRTIHVSGVVSPGAAARLQVRHAGHTFDDVTFLAAPPAWLADATLHVTGIPAGLDFNWLVNREFGVPGEREGGEPKPFRFPPLEVKDDQRIGVSAHGHNRFIVLDVLQSGDPIIVSQGHATDELGNPFKVTNPGPVFHLPTALAKGELRQLGDPQATVADGALVGLRPGRLYQGTFQRDERQTTQGEPEVRIVISVFYRRAAFKNPVGFATLDDVTGLPIPDYTGFQPTNRIGELLRERLATLQSGTILVVGRTSRTSDTGTDPAKLSKLNRDLQKGRAADASSLVKDALPSGTAGASGHRAWRARRLRDGHGQMGLAYRGRRPGRPGGHLRLQGRAAPCHVPAGRHLHPPGGLCRATAQGRGPQGQPQGAAPRPPDAPNPPVASLPADGRLRRLRLLAKWDREPVPVKLEALMVWELSKLAIPIDEDLNTDPDTTTDTCEGDAEDADFLRFLLRLVWDDRTGQPAGPGPWTAPGTRTA